MVQSTSPANRGRARPSSSAFRLRRNMRSQAAVLAARLALALAGCASHAKPLAASQPAPLSIPQTQVALPLAQPLNPDALPAEVPATPRPARRPATPAAAQPPEQRPAVQAIVPAQEQKTPNHSTQARKREVRADRKSVV